MIEYQILLAGSVSTPLTEQALRYMKDVQGTAFLIRVSAKKSRFCRN